jgi:uncharacterized membrane protein YebE (DUF533 family)
VSTLSAQKKELPVVVDAVYKAYNEGARPLIRWQSPDGNEVVSPEWTHDAITRHLIYSSEFRSLFHSAIDQVFHALIVTQNQNLISDGEVNEENRKAIMHTIKAYGEWMKVQHLADRAKSVNVPK